MTEFWENVDQVPAFVCPQDFLLSRIFNFDNTRRLKVEDYVCTDHEDCFHIKYVSHCRGNRFSPCYSEKKKGKKKCGICHVSDDVTVYRDISAINIDFRDFLVNEMVQDGKATRSGTGIGEGDSLCSRCYQSCRKKYGTARRGSSSTQAVSSEKPLAAEVPNDQSGESSKFCLYCPYERKFREANRSAVNSDLIKVAEFLALNDPEKAKKLNMSAAGIHEKCRLRLKNDVRPYQICLKCKKQIRKAPKFGESSKAIIVDENIKEKLNIYLRSTGFVPSEKDYQEKIHKFCLDQINKLDLTQLEDDEGGFDNLAFDGEEDDDSDSTLTYDDTDGVLHEINERFLGQIKAKLNNMEPVILKKAFSDLNDMIFEEAEQKNIYIPDMDRGTFHKMIVNDFMASDKSIQKFTSSKKAGSMLYKSDWDLADVLYSNIVDESENISDSPVDFHPQSKI